MAKRKKTTKKQEKIFPWRECFGWLFFIASVLSIVSVFGAFALQGEPHFLGPFLGDYISAFLTRSFGRLPLLLWLGILVPVSLRILFSSLQKPSWKSLAYFSLASLILSLWLSVSHLGLHRITQYHFVNGGGILGSFFMNFVFEPIVGSSFLAARIILGIVSFFGIIVAFSLKPTEWIQHLFSKIPTRSEKETVEQKPKKRKSIAETLIEAKEEVVPLKESEPELSFDADVDISKLTPMELRKFRDEKAQIDRVLELNEWEDQKPSKLKIGGILSKKEKEVPEVVEEDTDRTRKFSIHELKEFQEPDRKPYVVPDVSEILENAPNQDIMFSEESLTELSGQIEAQLANFRVKGKVTGITTGPVITRFEIDLAPGVKVSRISALTEDLALALRAKSIRILAPIPGKAAVGIEVPNPSAHIVYARPVLESDAFESNSDQIKIALGQDIAGVPFAMDLAKAPHLLIAGQTGSGKSVCINTLMASILCSKSPQELRMILVDPKVVELKPYEKIPHLLHPVVTDPEVAVQALQWACWEMDRRYDVLAKAKVRNLAGYNAKFLSGKLNGLVEEEDNAHMPFIVVVIDELADLMMVAGKEVEVSIARIAQKARAVGIHLVLATQRPSTNVITGTIKANLPTRISFKVASHIDARTIMDKMGAEKLLGRGDMLFKAIEDPEPIRVHGAFLSDEEVELLTDSCSSQHAEVEQLSSFDFENPNGQVEADFGPRDEKFEAAAELVVAAGQASASMFQRRLGVGYARAGKLIDQLESSGIVGPSRGSKARTVLMTEEELNSFLSGNTDDLILD